MRFRQRRECSEMTAIIDYGVGNLFSLQSSFAAIGQDAVVTGNPNEIARAERIVLPGVGAFEEASEKLKATGLGDVVCREVAAGKPLLGICLGMQLLFDKSYEFGEFDGLGLIPGVIRPIQDVISKELKIPHIGWNALRFQKSSKLFCRVTEGDCVYFVHSFYASDCEESVIATAEYSADLTAAVQKGNIYGCQFHPEKSGKVGLNILKAFCEDI